MLRVVQTEEWQPVVLSGPAALMSNSEAMELLEKWRISTGTDPQQYFEFGPQRLTPKNWSGVVSSKSVQLEVRPMGGLSLSSTDSKILDQNLSIMLQAVIGGSRFVFPDAELSGGGQRLHVFIATFLEQLAVARRRHVIRRYKTTTAVTPSVRGRMRFPGQLIESIRRPGYFSSEWVSLDENTPENRFLKAVMLFVRPLTGGELRARLEAQLVSFDQVTASADPKHDWAQIRRDRLPTAYLPVLRLGKAILDGEAAGLFSGHYEGSSEIVFTSGAFEAFLGAALARAAAETGYHAKIKAGGYLGSWATGPHVGAEAVEMIPDVQLIPMHNGLRSIVVDTKWKRLKPSSPNAGVNPGDVYQIVAYATRFGHERAVLLYPWVGAESPQTSVSRALTVNSAVPLVIYVATIPMIDPGFSKLGSIITALIETAGAQ
jgi:5-methylcytosine-specific restriction enzyme subunit McrC